MEKGYFYKRKIVVFYVLLLVISSSLAIPVEANSSYSHNDDSVNYQYFMDDYGISKSEAKDLFDNILRTEEFYKYDSNNILYFDGDSALKNGIDENLVAEIEEMFILFEEKEVNVTKTMAESCKGITLLDTSRSRFYADSCDTDQLIIALAFGATSAGVASLIHALWNPPAGAITGIIGLFVTFGATYISVKSKGCGIYGYWSGPHFGIHSQTC